MDPIAGLLIGLGRTFIPIISSNENLTTALKKNASVIAGAVTHCATVGGAVAAPALYAAFQSPLWGLGAALGLVSTPAWVPIAGGLAGLVMIGSGVKIGLDKVNYVKQRNAIRVGYQICSLLAGSVPQVLFKDELTTILRQYNLSKDDIAAIEGSVPAAIGAIEVGSLDEDFRRQILSAAAEFAGKADWSADVEFQFQRAADQLGLGLEAQSFRERSAQLIRAQGALIEGMFASCSHLFHYVNLENAEPFLAALKGWHPQAKQLGRTLKIGEAVASIGSLAAAASGQPAVAQVIAQTWNGCRTAAISLNDSRIDRAYHLMSAFFTRELGVKASEINRIRGDVDSAIETTLAARAES